MNILLKKISGHYTDPKDENIIWYTTQFVGYPQPVDLRVEDFIDDNGSYNEIWSAYDDQRIKKRKAQNTQNNRKKKRRRKKI